MLEQCIDLLGQLGEMDLQGLLLTALEQPPLMVPSDHTGPAATRMFQLALTVEQRREVLQAVTRAHHLNLSTIATQQRGLGGFLEAWREYVGHDC